MNTSYDVPTARKTIQLIELLCQKNEAVGATDLARELGLSKNMVFRLLHTLCDSGWVIKEPDGPRYRMSLQAFRCVSPLAARLDIRMAAEEPLRKLWKTTGECVHLGVSSGRKMTVVDVRETRRHMVKLAPSVGMVGFLHCGASGKLVLAHAPKAFVDQIVAKGLKKKTEKTITTKTALLKELAQIREAGYAVDREENATGIFCLAAPVWDHEHQVAGTVCLSVLSMYYTEKELIKQFREPVMKTAREISAAMGAGNNARGI